MFCGDGGGNDGGEACSERAAAWAALEPAPPAGGLAVVAVVTVVAAEAEVDEQVSEVYGGEGGPGVEPRGGAQAALSSLRRAASAMSHKASVRPLKRFIHGGVRFELSQVFGHSSLSLGGLGGAGGPVASEGGAAYAMLGHLARA